MMTPAKAAHPVQADDVVEALGVDMAGTSLPTWRRHGAQTDRLRLLVILAPAGGDVRHPKRVMMPISR
jgi:hypothetical protein